MRESLKNLPLPISSISPSKLGDLVELQRGFDLTAEERQPGLIPVIGGGGANGFHAISNVHGPGVVLARSGSGFGTAWWVNTDFWAHNTTLFVKDFKGNDPRYVYYVLDWIEFSKYNSGGAQPSLNRNFIYPIPVHVPPLPEQRKIAEILRTWDEAIEKLEALRAANLKRRTWMRTELFTGRTRLPGHKGEWREVTLGKVLTEHRLQGTGAEEVFSVSVHKGLINQIEHLGRSFAAPETGHYNRVLPGDIVYTKSPTGEFPLGIIKQSKISQEVIVSPLYGVFTPVTRELGVILDALFESPLAVRNYLRPLVQKGAKNTISITNRRFLEGKLYMPMEPAEQAAIAEVVEVSLAEFKATEAEIELLKRQKRGLMQKLLTGEWRVRC